MITCHSVFHVWPKTTLLLPVWPRGTKRLDTAESICRATTSPNFRMHSINNSALSKEILPTNTLLFSKQSHNQSLVKYYFENLSQDSLSPEVFPICLRKKGAKGNGSLHPGKNNFANSKSSDYHWEVAYVMSRGWQLWRMALLDKLASLLYSSGDKFDKKVKKHSPKMRRIIATKGLVRGETQVTEGGTNSTVSQIKLEEWLPWKTVCKVFHTGLEPS